MTYAPKVFGLLGGFAVGAVAALLIMSGLGFAASSSLVPILLGGIAAGWIGYSVAGPVGQLLGIAFVRYWLFASACWSMLLLMTLLWGIDLVGVDRLGGRTMAESGIADLFARPLVRTRLLVLWLGPPLFSLISLLLWNWARAAGGPSERS